MGIDSVHGEKQVVMKSALPIGTSFSETNMKEINSILWDPVKTA